ncbi:MAG: hypothetical protein KDF24_10210 [Rhodocyclaceae bacterium]|nr:hypothetical protein [Rhodocyclaceae bacterium]MCB1963523.1 hypothetical protein [Rhodocyclaceae bacterium]
MPRPDVYVFLDFDGVTHPWREVEDFRCLPRIEAVLREFEEARIVITSDWRTVFSQTRLAARFAEDIRPRIAGVTPLLLPKNGRSFFGLREAEARQWLAAHKAGDAAWLAIDDAPGNWPTRARLILTDFKRGFLDEDAARLRAALQAIRAGAWQDEDPAPRHFHWARAGLAANT